MSDKHFINISNVRLIESLSDMSNKMSSLPSRMKQATKNFTNISKNKSRGMNSASTKKYAKKKKQTITKRKSNWDSAFNKYRRLLHSETSPTFFP